MGAEATSSNLVGIVAGAGLGVATVRAMRVRPDREHPALWATALSLAALVYPAARKRWELRGRSAAEMLALIGYGGLSVAATRQPRPLASRALAAGWASHAAFDAAHGHDDDSRLPTWYPAMCAGYDLVVAAHLVRSA